MSQPVKRLACSNCLRPRQTCICRWATPITSAVEVLILQHPLEQKHAKGSARLLHLSLSNSRLLVDEAFDEEQLEAQLYQPWTLQAPRRIPILLYPDTPDDAGLPPAVPVDMSQLRPDTVRLVVLDGTWRKSRRMLYANPLLQALPRLMLRDVPTSRYLIRRARGAHQLSTLEATSCALMRLECDEARYVPLLDAFDGFVADRLQWRDRQVRRRDTQGATAAGDPA